MMEVLSESVDLRGATPMSSVDRDVHFVRFMMNGKVDALDVNRKPIRELCGHSLSKWSLIQERLAKGAALLLMSYGHERPIGPEMVAAIQRWT